MRIPVGKLNFLVVVVLLLLLEGDDDGDDDGVFVFVFDDVDGNSLLPLDDEEAWDDDW